MQGYVYLLQENDFDGSPTGLYKIGKTTLESIEKRSRQYKAGNPRPVVEYHSVYVRDCQATETDLHRQFNSARLKAGGGDEWFHLPGHQLSTVVAAMNAAAYQRKSRVAQPEYVPTCDHPSYSSFDDIGDLIKWVFVGILGFIAIGALISGNAKAEIQVGDRYQLQQDPYIGCPPAKQPCNSGNVWSDDYKVIAAKRNGSKFTVTGRPEDSNYIEVRFDDGLTGWVWKKSIVKIGK